MSDTAPERPAAWYDAQPGRVEWELAQFAARDLPATRRMGLRDGTLSDSLVIETQLPFQGAPVRIEVAFPFDYPDKAPMVFGPPGLLTRHQQPSDGNFCWAEDPDRDWDPGMDAAQIVEYDIRELLKDSEKGAAAVRAGEADMAEPVTGHLHFGDDVVVVADPFFAAEMPATEGAMTLVGAAPQFFVSRAAHLGRADPALQRYFVGADAPEELYGFWVALPTTPSTAELQTGLLELADARTPRLKTRLQRRLRKAQTLPRASCILGLTFMEEGPVRGQYRRNWVFCVVTLTRAGAWTSGALMRAQALTLRERQRRTPELVGLADARVLTIGAGSLGSPVVLELVKAGVGRVDVVDPDHFDVNNSVRHVASPQYAGVNKAVVAAVCARRLNPFVTVHVHDLLCVGAGALAATELSALVADADVVVDSTGSTTVARILQRHCTRHGKTLVVAGLTAGSHGGEVAVFAPDRACFDCFVLAQRDGSVPEPSRAPPGGLLTPVGCSHPAFTGAGFDGAELAAVTARAVVQASGACSYPASTWDWAVVNFRGPPRWQDGRLDKHPHCPHCS